MINSSGLECEFCVVHLNRLTLCLDEAFQQY